MMPNKTENLAKQSLGKKLEKTLPTEKIRVIPAADYQEALLACAVLSKLATRKRIFKTDILRFVQILRTRVTKTSGLIFLDVVTSSHDRIRVSLNLPAASISSLLLVSKDTPTQLAGQLTQACTYLNNPGLETQLLSLGKKDILIQSAQISSNLHHANIKVKGSVIVFA
jgi:hypothetical protein